MALAIAEYAPPLDDTIHPYKIASGPFDFIPEISPIGPIVTGIELVELPAMLQLQTSSAFDIRTERENFFNGALTYEGLINDINTFLWEYLTNMKRASFKYEVRENGTFGDGWAKSMEEMLQEGVDTANSPEERLLRVAEQQGFYKILDALNHNPDQLAVYASPQEAYGIYGSTFSLVYVYQMLERDGGQYLHATLYRVFNKDVNAHIENLSSLASSFREDPEKNLGILNSYQPENPETLIASPLFFKNGSPAEILHKLAELYGDNERNLLEQDANMLTLFEGFARQVDAFVDVFTNGEYSIEYMEDVFKIFLVKALTHFFDESKASKIVSDTALLARIKNTDFYDLLRPEYNATANSIFDLEIDLQGSCGTIGTSSIGDLIKAVDQATHPGENIEEKIFVCPECGHIHDISKGYVPHCENCGYDAHC